MHALALALTLVVAGQSHEPPKRLSDLAKSLSGQGLEVVVSDSDGNGWEVWVESEGPVADKTLRRLRGQKDVRSVRLLQGGFGDEGVSSLSGMPALHTLVLISDRLTDTCTVPVSALKGLVKLDLNRAKLTKTGLSRLAALPRLERLYLYNAQVPDRDFLVLGALKRLKVLSLPKSVSGRTVEKLRKLLQGTAVDQV